MDDNASLASEVSSSQSIATTASKKKSRKSEGDIGRRGALVDKLAGISRKVIKVKRTGKNNAQFDEDELGPLPPPDYYYRSDADAVNIDEDEEEFNNGLSFTPTARNAVEMTNRFYVERNLYSYMAHTTIPTEKNYYDDDEVDLACYTQKPIGFLILGKPGVGKTTLARRLATKMNIVHICPEEVIEYYRFENVVHHQRVNEVLEAGGTISDELVGQLIEARVRELDVLHRGYVLDGFPMVQSEFLTIEEQIETLERLSILPQYAIMLQIQDADLYKRRISQKLDPETSEIFIQDQYLKFNPDENVFPHQRNKPNKGNRASMSTFDVAELNDLSGTGSSSGSGMKGLGDFENMSEQETPDNDPLDGSRDFPSLPPDTIFRLITRTEDNPVLVNDDLQQFRKCLPELQNYVEKFDKRKVLELDAYFAPSVIFRKTYEFLETCGVSPVPIPVQIMRPLDLPVFKRNSEELGEFLGEDDDSEAPCPDDEPPPEIDWESAMRAVSVRGLVDPRFRWRISKWQNLCPVALKYGRSTVGKPELATSFLDKVFFLSSPAAVEQFIFNPRPYLLPKMPTSPVKFFVLGHPLAGKSSLAKELALITKSKVLDMNHEMEKRYGQVKHDYLYKKRVKYTLEAKVHTDKENHKEWKRQERARRAAMHKWVDDYIRSLAEAEIQAALDADRERRRAERILLTKEAAGHALRFPVHMASGMCQGDDGWNKFCWKDFVRQVHAGKTNWTHQELLELAWDLYHQRRLYYKRIKRDGITMTMFGDVGEDDEDLGLLSLLGEDEELGETEMQEEEEEMALTKSKKKRRRRKCKGGEIYIKPIERMEEEEQEEEVVSSDIDPNDNETEESIRMRYPMIPSELVDIIPPPTMVQESHPIVQDIVNRKLEEDEKYVHSLPIELYIEVLKRACAEAESQYLKVNTHGPMSGGWIVENLMTDIDKFRAILRTPEVCPDQIFLLQDRAENRGTIYGRLKQIYKLKNPPPGKKRSTMTKQSFMNQELGEMMGEGGFPMGPEETVNLNEIIADELDQTNEEEKETVQNLLPIDTLTDPLEDTPSNLLQIFMDAKREQTPATTEDEDPLDALLSQHERFILEQVRTKIDSASSVHSYESYNSGSMRRHIAAEFKSLNCEMTAYIKEDDGSRVQSDEATTAEMLKEDARVITAYLRHSREIGALAYSRDGTIPTGEESSDFLKTPITPDQNRISTAEGKVPTPLPPVMAEDGEEISEDVGESFVKPEEIKDPNETPTPEGLRSVTGLTELENQKIACPESLNEDEKAKCLKEKQQQKIESPKRRFFIQIRLFEEFWNPATLVCNEQGVKFWEVGLVDGRNSQIAALNLWYKLEERFQYKAKRISENELREEDEEIHESLMKWGEPYEHNNPKGIPDGLDKKKKSEENSDDESEELSESDEEDLQEERDILSQLDGKPDLYWKTVRKMEEQRCFGDMKYYCPVTLMEMNLLRKGYPEFACKYRDRLYYCGDESAVAKFLTSPAKYLPASEPKNPPPPKICITGSPGCGQEEVALKLAKEYNICYVNFRQRLHELMKARFGRDIGPNKTGDIVTRLESEKLIEKCRSGDDMLQSPQFDDDGNEIAEEDAAEDSSEADQQNPTVLERRADVKDEEDWDEEEEGEEEEHGPREIPPLDLEDITINEAAMRSLGLLETAALNTVPIGSVERTERLTERKWKKLTKIETYVQAFLENGIQLPDEVLDEFIGCLWTEAPFNQVGFILVGFPNTEADVKYLMRNRCFPEFVFVLECQPIVIRNRLLIETVDKWHKDTNPSGKKKKTMSETQRLKAFQKAAATQFALMMGGHSDQSLNAKGMTKTTKAASLGFAYQTEGRPVIDEYEQETWTYNDAISKKVTKALKHFHGIYSRSIRYLKQALNRNRIDWFPLNADANLFEAKRTVIENIIPRLKFRSSVFEDIVRLNLKQANALINRGVFCVSKFQRWCPVELKSGNTAMNMWNAESIPKFPILYRRYIYFLSGLKNSQQFEHNCWQLINQDAPLNTVPAIIVVMGPPKSGKTTLAKKLANRLGLVYMSGSEMIDDIIRHSFVSQWKDVLNEIEPKMLADGPQPMVFAEEILSYIRNGQALPKFLLFRALDLALLQPKAQYHGVIFDDYPVTEDQLQELLYRGVVPATVIKLQISVEEACARCERNRKPDYNYIDIPEEGDSMIEFATSRYSDVSDTTLLWFQHEVQNTFVLDGTQNMEMLFLKSAEKCKANMKKMQQYLVNVLLERPSTLEGTCPLTSQIPLRLSPDFGFYCPVALNDSEDLVRVANVTNLKDIVEYKGHVYVFASEHNTHKFMANPKKYTVPNCIRIPPPDVPLACLLTNEQFQDLKGHWGFLDFDAVRYYDANHHYKGLQRGDAKFCVAYRKKLYCFINQENMNTFMKKPQRYWNQMLPLKVPRKTEPLDMEKITPYCYLIANGVLSEVKKAMQLTGEKRPRVPFMSSDRAAALFMGYHFKSHNMNAEYEMRQKYRSAMFDMIKTKTETKKFLTELQPYYGCRLKSLPERMRTRLEDFLKMERMSDEEKVLVPKSFPGGTLSRESVKVAEDELEIALRYQKVKEMLISADINEKVETFRTLPEKRKFHMLQAMLSTDERAMSPRPPSRSFGFGCSHIHHGSGHSHTHHHQK